MACVGGTLNSFIAFYQKYTEDQQSKIVLFKADVCIYIQAKLHLFDLKEKCLKVNQTE